MYKIWSTIILPNSPKKYYNSSWGLAYTYNWEANTINEQQKLLS